MSARIKIIKSRGKWKDVQINPNIFLKDDFSNFVCMQELTDYNVFSSGKKKKVKKLASESLDKKKHKKKKKKTTQTADLSCPAEDAESLSEPADDHDDVIEKEERSKKKGKKLSKKAAKNSRAAPKDSSEATELLESRQNKHENCKRKFDEEDTETVESGTVVPAKKGKPSRASPDEPKKGKRSRSTQKESKKDKRKKKKTKSRNAESELTTLVWSADAETNKRKAEEPSPVMTKKSKWDKSHLKDDKKRYKETDSLPDMTAWCDLYVPHLVLRALADQGFTAPTPIQTLTLAPAIRDRLDIVGAAETGSGKTLAFGIPLIHRILRLKEERATELANQDASSDDGSAESTNQDDESGDDEIRLASIVAADGEVSDTSGESDVETEVDQSQDGAEVDQSQEGSDSGHSDTSAESDTDEEFDGSEDADLIWESESEAGEDSDMDRDDEVDSDMDRDDEEEYSYTEEAAKQVGYVHERPLYALILTPTRELAIQVRDHLVAVATYTGIKVVAIVGGMAQPKQLRLLKYCPEIVVATPGRLWELLGESEPHLSKVREVSCLVVDEADRMVEKGHFQELTQLLQIINSDEEKKKKRQTFVFSATLTFVHTGPERLKYDKKASKISEKLKLETLMSQIGVKAKPKVIDLTRSVGTAEGLVEARINTPSDEKDMYLYYFLCQYKGRTLVFANSKDCIRRLTSIFKLLECCPLPLHADMQQRQRLKNLDRFKGNPNGLLLATDVAARGLDIPDVQHVIHYQVPRTSENYIHRSGRTARASKEGLSVMLIGPQDLSYYRKIIKSLNRDEDLPLFPVEQDAFANIKIRINLTRSIETDEHRQNKKRRENQWFEKAAEETGIILDDNDRLLNDLGSEHEQSHDKKNLEASKQQLKMLLQAPLQRYSSGKYPTKSGKLQPLAVEHGGAVSKVKAEHSRDKKLRSYIPIHQPNKQDRRREKKFQNKKRKGKI